MSPQRQTQARRDQQADAMGSVNDFIECNEDQCDTSERWKHIKDEDSGWQVSNDPGIPLLCPECTERTPDDELTPTEAREKYNQSLREWS